MVVSSLWMVDGWWEALGCVLCWFPLIYLEEGEVVMASSADWKRLYQRDLLFTSHSLDNYVQQQE